MISPKCLKMHSAYQMMISTQMFKGALGLTNAVQYSNVKRRTRPTNDVQYSNVSRCTRAYNWWSVLKCLKMHSNKWGKKFKQTTCNKAMLQKNKYDSTTKHISFIGAMKETFLFVTTYIYNYLHSYSIHVR